MRTVDGIRASLSEALSISGEHPMSEQVAPTIPQEKSEIFVKFEGKEEPAMEMGFSSEREEWATYHVEDGTQIKLKNTISRVLKLTGRVKEDGTPIYVIEGSAVVTTIVPGKVIEVPTISSSGEADR